MGIVGCRFAFLADVQIGCLATFSGTDAEGSERFARRGMCVRAFPSTASLDWERDRFTDVVRAVERHEVDFVVIGGDMVDAADRADQLDVFRAVAAGFGDLPVHLVPGNHDACADGAIPTEDSLDWYRATFGDDHGSFTADLGDGTTASFVTVNSSVLDQPRHLPGADERELAFLERELAAAAARPGPTIVFSHHPPFVTDPDEPDTYWNLPRATRQAFLDLLVQHGVALVLCGHRHRNAYATYEGVQIVTSSATGFPLGHDAPGYRLVELTAHAVTHEYHPVADPQWETIGGPPGEHDC